MIALRPFRIPGLARANGVARRRSALAVGPVLQGRLVLAAELLLGAAILWLLFSIAQMIVTPLPVVPSAAPMRAAAEVRVSAGPSDPFRLSDAPAAPVAAQASGEGLADTTANLKLYGTWLDNKGGMAIIGVADAAQVRSFPGDTIAPGVTLESVQRDHVVILRSGVREALRLLRTPPAMKAIRGAQSVAPPPGAAVVNAPQGMLAVDNGSEGFNLVVESGDPQMLNALGLESGDVIIAIDNRPIPADLKTLFERMGARPTAPATIIRNGGTMTLNLKVSEALRVAQTARQTTVVAATPNTE